MAASDATAGAPDHVSGVFVYWGRELFREGPEGWEARFAFLRGLRMDTIVVQFSVIEGTAYYPSPTLPQALPGGDPTGVMLAAAERAGFAVHLGVASDEKHWWDLPKHRAGDLPTYVPAEAERNNLISQELVARYGNSPALAGIYLSHEIHLGDEWAGANLPYLVDLFNRLTDGVRSVAPRLLVSTAPFFSLDNPVELYEERWRGFLSQTHLDILMLQDGIGCKRQITVDNMGPFYESLSRVCQETGVEFWTDLELFDLNPPKIVPPERVAMQLAREAPFVRKVVAYSLSDLTPEFAAALPGVAR
jgi:hypothetical protein